MRREHTPRGDFLAQIAITPYERRFRNDVRELVFHSYRTHSHLDWMDTDQYLDSAGRLLRLAWSNRRLVGVMGTSAPLNGACWLRLTALADDVQPHAVLHALWDEFLPEFRAHSVNTVVLLVLRSWITNYIGDLGFHYLEDIVTLRRTPHPLPHAPRSDVTIRLADFDELELIAGIDQAAFSPPWQLTLHEIRLAERASVTCTVAMLGGRIAGYQLSTLYFDGAHLARLAVVPDAQGSGIGAALLIDLIERLERRGVNTITVNTQSSNERSQRLYRRFNFERNGYDMPVWIAKVE